MEHDYSTCLMQQKATTKDHITTSSSNPCVLPYLSIHPAGLVCRGKTVAGSGIGGPEHELVKPEGELGSANGAVQPGQTLPAVVV